MTEPLCDELVFAGVFAGVFALVLTLVFVLACVLGRDAGLVVGTAGRAGVAVAASRCAARDAALVCAWKAARARDREISDTCRDDRAAEGVAAACFAAGRN